MGKDMGGLTGMEIWKRIAGGRKTEKEEEEEEENRKRGRKGIRTERKYERKVHE